MIPKYIKKLQSESRTLRARRVDAQTVIVESETHPESYYEVTVKFNDAGVVYATCTCEWAKHNGVGCSHVLAALEYLAGLKARTLSFWLDENDARRQKHRTFTLIGDNQHNRIWITSRNSPDAA